MVLSKSFHKMITPTNSSSGLISVIYIAHGISTHLPRDVRTRLAKATLMSLVTTSSPKVIKVRLGGFEQFGMVGGLRLPNVFVAYG